MAFATLEARREYQNRYTMEKRIKVYTYLCEHPCVDCGEADPVVLDFDHRDPDAKHRSISHMMRGTTSWKKIFEEIQKCDVRCANCHRRRTAVQFGYKQEVLALVAARRPTPEPVTD